MATSKNPLKQIMDIRRDEVPQALLMFAYFFGSSGILVAGGGE